MRIERVRYPVRWSVLGSNRGSSYGASMRMTCPFRAASAARLRPSSGSRISRTSVTPGSVPSVRTRDQSSFFEASTTKSVARSALSIDVAVFTMRVRTLPMSVSRARSCWRLRSASSCVAALTAAIRTDAMRTRALFWDRPGDFFSDLAHRLDRVDLGHRLVWTQSHDPRETHRVAGVVPVRLLDLVERDLGDRIGAHDAKTTKVLHRAVKEVLRHVGDL